MAKRGLNIYKRKDGRWEGRICQKQFSNGRCRYRSLYGKSYREVKEKMTALLAAKEPTQKQCDMTVPEVVSIWLRDKKGIWKESTYACYRQLAERHIYKETKTVRASDFSNVCFCEYVNNITKSDGSKISPAYSHGISAVLIQAFAYVSREYRYQLPNLENPKLSRTGKNMEIPSEKTMKKLEEYLLSHTKDSTCLGILLSYYTGIRIGELCALTWGDIDFEEGILKISKNLQRIKDFGEETSATHIKVQTPKTLTSIRCIPIPEEILAILKRHRKDANCYLVEGTKKAWAEARTVQYRFAAILKTCGIEYFKFHMLRHYFASRCIRQSFDMKSLSEILGHASVQITMNLYVHSSMCQKRLLMNRLTKAA